jgi:CheY-like chemotaxis protein
MSSEGGSVTKPTTTIDQRPPAVILLVEDDLADQILTREAFESVEVPHDLRIVNDGKEALDYLYHRDTFGLSERAPRPDLILLDLNLPRVNGQEVAKQIRGDPALQDIPIVVLTTSRRQEDILQAYGRGATSFITKPLDLQHFLDIIHELQHLLRFVVDSKTLRRRARPTRRQMVRLLQHQQKLEHLTDALFDHHMSQIQEVLGAEAKTAAPVSAEVNGRDPVARLAQKILDGVPAERAAAAPGGGRSQPERAPRGWRNWPAPWIRLPRRPGRRAREIASRSHSGRLPTP